MTRNLQAAAASWLCLVAASESACTPEVGAPAAAASWRDDDPGSTEDESNDDDDQGAPVLDEALIERERVRLAELGRGAGAAETAGFGAVVTVGAGAIENVRSRGAIGNGKTLDTRAFQAALDACRAQGSPGAPCTV